MLQQNVEYVYEHRRIHRNVSMFKKIFLLICGEKTERDYFVALKDLFNLKNFAQIEIEATGWRLIPLSQVWLDSEPSTGHDRGRWPFLTRSSHFSNGFRTKRTAPSSCLSAAGRMASFVLGAVGIGVTC